VQTLQASGKLKPSAAEVAAFTSATLIAYLFAPAPW